MSWEQYRSILREAADYKRDEDTRPPLACPNDGEPLEEGPNGVLHCKYDGWVYQG